MCFLLACMTSLTIGCAMEDQAEPTTSNYESRAPAYKGAIVDLCLALEQSRTDREGAETIFEDRAHPRLHDIARDTEQEDRAAAAELLQAKNRVEENLKSGEGDLTADLGRLLDASRKALEVLELDPPGCPQPGGGPTPSPQQRDTGY